MLCHKPLIQVEHTQFLLVKHCLLFTQWVEAVTEQVVVKMAVRVAQVGKAQVLMIFLYLLVKLIQSP
jgi:hypothetical protein